MQVILKENIIGLGYKDDVVTVKDGYGRNYLIPTGKAVIANKSALKALDEELKQRAKKIAKIKADAEAQAAKLSNIKPISIEMKVSANGSTYGSVNAATIAEELAKQGLEIDRKLIVMKDAKTVGTHTAVIKLHKDVEVEVLFTIVAEGAEAEVAPATEEVVSATEESTEA